jgi:hypothetical protein
MIFSLYSLAEGLALSLIPQPSQEIVSRPHDG